ncbi:hypothetical protein [Mitsuaria sp. GD03876]|uniref:hypothetical protein n=1 Tax=Mitsuaria sp. GD03876 TaxID=2975399 RepID=UPI00244C674B|nr:hypothetical protein [Mitsuaria sp. GD03876]MDH0867281.1 hypothetical protein [Mitsuaria sp. GD03876]
MTLRQLVDAASRQKAAELASAAARLAAGVGAGNGNGNGNNAGIPAGIGAAIGNGQRVATLSPDIGGAAGAASDEPPRLWSLQMVRGRWQAEIVVGGRVHRLDASGAATGAAASEASGGAACGAAGDAAGEAAGAASGEASDGTSGGTSSGAPGGTSSGASGGVSSGVSSGASGDAAGDSSRRAGPWRAIALTAGGLLLERTRPVARAPRHLLLAPPGRGSVAAAFPVDRVAMPAAPLAAAPSPSPSLSPELEAWRRAAALPLPAGSSDPAPSAASPPAPPASAP